MCDVAFLTAATSLIRHRHSNRRRRQRQLGFMGVWTKKGALLPHSGRAQSESDKRERIVGKKQRRENSYKVHMDTKCRPTRFSANERTNSFIPANQTAPVFSFINATLATQSRLTSRRFLLAIICCGGCAGLLQQYPIPEWDGCSWLLTATAAAARTQRRAALLKPHLLRR